MDLKFIEHLFKNLHALLVPVVDLGQQREVVSGILVKNVIFNYHHLKFLHVEPCVHLDSAFVYQVYYH